MHTTWLDSYVKGSSNRFAKMIETKKAIHKQFPKLANTKAAPLTPLMKQAMVNDGAAFRWAAEKHEQEIKDGVSASPRGVQDSEVAFRVAVLPFFRNVPGHPKPLAAQLDEDVVGNFCSAAITDEIKAAGTAHLEGNQLVYLDLPPLCYRLEIDQFKESVYDDGAYLRAIFMENTAPTPSFFAIFTGGDIYGYRMIGWNGSSSAGNSFIRSEADGDGMMRTWLSVDDDLGAALSEIEDFTHLTLAYIQIEQENRPAPFEQLPYLPIDDPRRYGRKAKQVQKKFSLFSTVKVTGENLARGDARRDRPNINPETPPLPRDRNRRHSVRGHFKLQAVGPGWSQRRLRWIAAFDRGDINSTPVTRLRTLTRLPEGQPAAPT